MSGWWTVPVRSFPRDPTSQQARPRWLTLVGHQGHVGHAGVEDPLDQAEPVLQVLEALVACHVVRQQHGVGLLAIEVSKPLG